MSVFNSVQFSEVKPKVEAASPLSITGLLRKGYLEFGCFINTTLNWTFLHDGSKAGSIGFRSWLGVQGDPNHIELNGKYLGEPFSQTIALTSIPGTKGGVRWYAVCPVSGRRCLKLVLSPKHRGWVSVPVSGLRYESEGKDSLVRCRLAIDRAKAKQKRMSKYTRYPTRDRLAKELLQLEEKRFAEFALACDGRNQRVGRAGSNVELQKDSEEANA